MCIVQGNCFFQLQAQSGMTMSDFSEKLLQYFDEEMIADIQKQIPDTTKCKVWSWDIADFSGDTYPDLAFVVKNNADKKKIATVYLFTDIEGFLTKIAEYEHSYVEMPLEVGIVIRHNTCFITSKIEQFNWNIKGYTFDNGFVIHTDEFSTSRIAGYTRETYNNFQTLESKEKLIDIKTDNIAYDHSYLSIPAYSKNVQEIKGISSRVLAHKPDFAVKGAFYWQGDSDCSFDIHNIHYDTDYLTFDISVTDDALIYGRCDTCTSDYVDIWFTTHPPSTDVNQYIDKRINKKKRSADKKLIISDSGTMAISIKPGDFLEQNSTVSIIKSEDYTVNASLLSSIKHSSSLTKTGYVLKIAIPLLLLGNQIQTEIKESIKEIGFSVVVHDCDNQFRPEEETILATSSFIHDNSDTLGSLLFLPEGKKYGESLNIFSEPFSSYLLELGF